MNAYPITNIRSKGCYVARITGLDDQYIVALDFLRGNPAGPFWEYTEQDIGGLPAWIVRAGTTCGGCGRPDPNTRDLIAATEIGYELVAEGVTTRDLENVWKSGPPGPNPDEQATEAITPKRVPVYAANKEDPF